MKVYRVSIRAIGDGGQYNIWTRANSVKEARVAALRGVGIHGEVYPRHDFGDVFEVVEASSYMQQFANSDE
jgi:hypothetical protein